VRCLLYSRHLSRVLTSTQSINCGVFSDADPLYVLTGIDYLYVSYPSYKLDAILLDTNSYARELGTEAAGPRMDGAAAVVQAVLTDPEFGFATTILGKLQFHAVL
jgi:hypothetical protein